jgi:hypothetical protein
MKLLLERPCVLGSLFQDRLRRIDLRAGRGVDEKQFLLDAQRERAARAELRIAGRDGLSAQASECWSVSPSALSSSS